MGGRAPSDWGLPVLGDKPVLQALSSRSKTLVVLTLKTGNSIKTISSVDFPSVQ